MSTLLPLNELKMSQHYPMASIPPSPLNFSDDNQKPDIESVRTLIAIINHHMQTILEDTQAQKSIKLKCTSKLKIQSQEFFEFSEHSVLSNLYWGIENTDSATQSKYEKDRAILLENSEKMLQIPASLDENGVTLTIPNSFLACSSYFYLSIVESLRENEWQVAMHFLQAVSISPTLVCEEFAPGIYHSLSPLLIRHDNKVDGSILFGRDYDDVMRLMARRYKPWLMYYQIMSGVDDFHGNRGDGISWEDGQSQCSMRRVQRCKSITESKNPSQHRTGLRTCENFDNEEELITNSNIPMLKCHKKIVPHLEKISRRDKEAKGSSNIRCLKDILTEESEPDSPTSLHSHKSSSIKDGEEDYIQHYAEDAITSPRTGRIDSEDHIAEAPNHYGSLSWSKQTISFHLQTEANEIKTIESISRSFSTSFCDRDISPLGLRKMDKYTLSDNYTRSISLKNHHKSTTLSRMTRSSSLQTTFPDEFFTQNTTLLEKIISKLCFTEDCEEVEEMKTIYEILNSKSGLKYSLLKDIILDQLLTAISTSKEERVVKTSIAILSAIVTTNRSAIEDVKRKGLQLDDLATALKRNNVHEAVILIYLIDPSPLEIKTLELLPCLVELVCSSNSYCKMELSIMPFLTPPSASLMIIEVLVTSFDYETNGIHLAAICSPRVLTGLLQVPRKDNLEEFVSLASVLVRCMRFDGTCRKYIAETSPVAPFVSLLCSSEKRANSVALEYFNELHRMPRSSAIGLLENLKKNGGINVTSSLFMLTQKSEPEYRLLAANLLLQLEVLEDASENKCVYGVEAVEALLESLTCDDSTATQALSALILSNIGGTYSWKGEPYTMAWLVKKTGLTSASHRNLIKNCDFLDQSLQDAGIDSWCSKISQWILSLGDSVFHALGKGLNSKLKRVSRDCLAATAWLGCELVKGPDELRHAACEIMMQAIEQYVHPGFELEERLLACLCIYNYTSGRGMKRLINLSEGVRESLRRLSSVTWMAEELLKVADYFQPNKWRISCVHSQILEAGSKLSGAVTALIYYKGLLHSGYSDGSIKVWEIKGQTATLVQEIKKHKKAVTCFALYEPGNCLLSGSSDKTIKMWKMFQSNLECIEVIPTKESIRSIESWGETIFATTQNHKLKVIDESRKIKDVFKNKRVKCIRVAHGKVYAGCSDSSIQELMIANNRQQEIKGPTKRVQKKAISSVAIYKDWLYSASLVVEGSKIKDCRRSTKPQISTVPEKGSNILAMEVVEDFIYLNCSASTSSLQILLRGTEQKVGRLSGGSKITSLLSANDMVLCGTEKGVIKGWIPL